MIRFAERMNRLGTEGAFEVLAKARRLEADGHKIVLGKDPAEIEKANKAD